MTDAPPNRETDLLTGIQAIADAIGITKRQAYHLHETGELPTFKMGGKVYARRSTLAKHFAEQEAAARNG
ncbi:MAG: DNA-binding protein [Sphingomonas phyllosphaerae]|uniref:DNA-binding protein n=1 Tax=Sphingomonas phyllosphaerae TaxID=257003 RepID=UPI002FFA5E34